MIGIVVYFLYAVVAFRKRGQELEDGAPIKGHGPTQTLWIVLSSALVLALAIWGSLVLVVSAHGAGGGQGPKPINPPSGSAQALQVQVIGQQWAWTYRYPASRGLETAELELPADTLVEFHVTSLDVTHSFWAYELGVKADAVPGADNVAYVHTHRLGQLHHPLLGAVRPLAHAHDPDRPRRFRRRVRVVARGGAEDRGVEPQVPASLRAVLLPRAAAEGRLA